MTVAKKTRVYLSPCQLEINSNSKYQCRQMILVGILTTLCVESRNHFILYNTEQKQCELWKETTLLKEFWCCPEIPIDFNTINNARDHFLYSHRWLYDETRRCPRDTKNPGNFSSEWQRDNHLELSQKWELRAGPPTVASSKFFEVPQVTEYAIIDHPGGFRVVNDQEGAVGNVNRGNLTQNCCEKASSLECDKRLLERQNLAAIPGINCPETIALLNRSEMLKQKKIIADLERKKKDEEAKIKSTAIARKRQENKRKREEELTDLQLLVQLEEKNATQRRTPKKVMTTPKKTPNTNVNT
jgi:hypothetical protein